MWYACGPLVVWSGRPTLAAGPKGSVDLRFALLHAMGTHSLYNLLILARYSAPNIPKDLYHISLRDMFLTKTCGFHATPALS